jgi:hypothetical protein
MTITQFVPTVLVGFPIAWLMFQATFRLVRRTGWTGFRVWLFVVFASAFTMLLLDLLFHGSHWISQAIRSSGMIGSILGGFWSEQVNKSNAA